LRIDFTSIRCALRNSLDFEIVHLKRFCSGQEEFGQSCKDVNNEKDSEQRRLAVKDSITLNSGLSLTEHIGLKFLFDGSGTDMNGGTACPTGVRTCVDEV